MKSLTDEQLLALVARARQRCAVELDLHEALLLECDGRGLPMPDETSELLNFLYVLEWRAAQDDVIADLGAEQLAADTVTAGSA